MTEVDAFPPRKLVLFNGKVVARDGLFFARFDPDRKHGFGLKHGWFM